MLPRIKIVGLIAGILLFTLPQGSFAQGDSEEEITRLDTLIVTGTKKEAKLLDTPASITVITVEDIEKSGIRSTADLVGSLPGIIDQSISESRYYDFRGTKSSDSTGPNILVDGRKISYGLYGGNIIESIPLETIERIEVIRTPGSFVTGPDSARGVINIITKKGKKLEKVFKPKLSASYGSWDSYKGEFSASGKFEKLDYYMSSQYKESEGYRHTNPEYTTVSGNVGYELLEGLKLGLNGQYNDVSRAYAQSLQKWQLDGGYRRSAEVPSSQTASAYMYKQSTTDYDVLAGTISLDYDRDGNLLGLSLGGTDYDEEYFFRKYENSSSATTKAGCYRDNRDQDMFDFKVFAGKEFSIGNLVNTPTIGYDFSGEELIQRREYPYDTTGSKESSKKKANVDFEKDYHGIYFNNDLSYEKFSLGSGIRYEEVKYDVSSQQPRSCEKEFDNWAWNIAPSYSIIPSGNLYFSTSQAYWYPQGGYYKSAIEKDIAGAEPEGLKPEDYLTYEVGFKHRLAKYLNYSVSLFHMKIMDRYIYLYDDAGTGLGWRNAGDSINRGVDVEADGKPFDWFGYRVSLSYLDAEWDRGSAQVYEHGATPAGDVKKNMDISGKKLHNIPDFQYKIGLDFYPIKALQFSVDIHGRGDQYIDLWNRYENSAVCLVDTRLGYKLKDWDFYASCSNIFGKEHEYIYNTKSQRNGDGTPNNTYYPNEERYVEVGATVTF